VRGIVCAETNNVLLYVKEVVEDSASYSALDRLEVYEELLGRLKTQTKLGAAAEKEQTHAIDFLKRQVEKEQTPEIIIKIDSYLKDSDQSYRTSDARRKLLRKGASSNVPTHKRYFFDALQSLEKE
jgi:hypothetical protein